MQSLGIHTERFSRHLKKEQVIYYTYQSEDEWTYRVVIRHIHHSIPTDEIKTELEK